MATGNKKGAIEVLEKAARMNGQDYKKIKDKVMALKSPGGDQSTAKPKFSALIATKELRKRTILLCFNWYLKLFLFLKFPKLFSCSSG